MSAIEIIRQTIDEDVFDYTQLINALKNYKKPRDAISIVLRKKQIIRVRKGLYIFGELWQKKGYSREMLANLVYGPSVISLDFALSFHGLIPEHVYPVTSVSLGRSRVYNTPVGRFTYTQQKAQRLSFGSFLQQNNAGNRIMAEPLKALADKVWTDKRFKPTSPSSFAEYLFEDLRIDEDTLIKCIDASFLEDLVRVYSSRKIVWLKTYLLKRYN